MMKMIELIALWALAMAVVSAAVLGQLVEKAWAMLMFVCRDWLLMIVIIVALILGLSVANNKSAWGADPYPEFDRWGFRYPLECRRDLSFMLDTVPLEYTSMAGWAETGRYIGYFWWGKGGPKIFIDPMVKDPTIRKEVIHHELCHAYMYYKHGDARWHPE